MLLTFHVIIGVAILFMAVALVQVFRLKRLVRGGHIGGVINTLFVFVVVFCLTYIAAPVLTQIDVEQTIVLTAVVFLLGAVFVVIVLRLIRSLIKKVFEELDL